MLKVGIIGLGSIAKKHIEALGKIDRSVQIYGLRHRVDSAAVDLVSDVYDVEQLLNAAPDFIIISNPTANHLQTINRVANSGVPLFIEKPLFDQLHPLPQVEQLTYVACNLRFLDCLTYVKQHIVGLRINEVSAYCGSYLPEWREGEDWRTCYSANKEMGGGVHIDLIHEIDYIYWLFGEPETISKTFRSVSSLNISSFDYANYILNYVGFSASVVLNYYRRDYKRTLEILTDNDTWSVDLKSNSVHRNGELVFCSDQQVGDTYKAQMEYFIKTLESSERFNDINQGYEVLTICLNDEIE